ncbi:hypothetical protein EYR26_15035 [Xanthomonas oryzae]|nr:hypothetical protein EYR26_15035 [Xanthomonas oryzae]
MICSSEKRFFTSNLLGVGNWTPNQGATQSPLKNPQTTSIARLHLRYRCAGIASFRYATSWFLAVFAHAYTPSCRRAVACR